MGHLRVAMLLLGMWLAARPAPAAASWKGQLLFGVRNVSLAQATELGVSWCVGPVISWGAIEPRRGTRNWARLDALVRGAGQSGVELIPILCCYSPWGSAPGLVRANAANRQVQQSGYPADANAWSAFVKALVERYDGDGTADMPSLAKPIKTWQLERELPRGWGDSAAALIRYLKLTSSALKGADPAATVVAGGITASALYGCAFVDKALDSLIVDGRPLDRANLAANKVYRAQRQIVDALLGPGAAYYDVVDLHLLGNCGAIPAVVRWINDWPAVKAKPKWCLQGGAPVAKFDGATDESELPNYLVKWYALLAAAGVQRGAWAAAPETGSSESYRETALFTEAGPRRAACTAYSIARARLGGFTGVAHSRVGLVTHVRFVQPEGDVVVIWADSPCTIEVGRRKARKITTAEGRPVPLPGEKIDLGPAPLYAE